MKNSKNLDVDRRLAPEGSTSETTAPTSDAEQSMQNVPTATIE